MFVITASNHPELLDRAVWRRFQLKLELNKPNKKQIIQYLKNISQRTGIEMDYSFDVISNKLIGLSFAEIEEFGIDIFRQAILQRKQNDTKKIINETLTVWENKFKINTLQ